MNLSCISKMNRVIDELKSEKIGHATTDIVIQTWTDGDWAKESGTLVLQEINKSPEMK